MTLRLRLLLTAAVILLVVAVGGVVIVHTQEDHLIGRIDQQLGVSRPLLRPPPDGGSGPGLPDRPGEAPDTPVSDLYVGIVDEEGVETVLRGQLLDDVPAVDAATLQDHGDDDSPFTLAGRDTGTRFRAVLQSDSRDGTVFLIALPLDSVDQAVASLRSVLLLGGAAIAVALGIGVWSVERLGLRPVARVTEVADAIARGSRGRRVADGGRSTEADRLARAFNVMLDEREADEERLRRFISDASHELRTPLTSIRGYLDLYREGGFRGEGELDDVIRRLSGESARMQALVEDLLLLARLDERPPMRTEPVDLARLLRDAASDARAVQPDRPVDLDVPDVPVPIDGDPLRLQQLVGILVSNALTHTPPDRRIHLGARRRPVGVEFVVADDGPGIDPADAARIFDRFHRGDRSRTRSTGGAGLGLAIARSIVDAHGGDLVLDDADGGGAAFTVTLPDTPR